MTLQSLKGWTVETAIQQIEKCGFECEAGPIDNSSAWRWLKEHMTRTIPEAPGSQDMDAVAIFEMGFEWAMCLRGQTLEDSRAVGRTLFSDIFTPIADRLDTSDFNSFESAEAGIVAAKAIIHAALTAPTPSGDVESLIVEKVARAVCEADNFKWDSLAPTRLGELDLRETYRSRARAAIAAITSHDTAILLRRFCEIMDETDDEGFTPDIEQKLMDLHDAALKEGA